MSDLCNEFDTIITSDELMLDFDHYCDKAVNRAIPIKDDDSELVLMPAVELRRLLSAESAIGSALSTTDDGS